MKSRLALFSVAACVALASAACSIDVSSSGGRSGYGPNTTVEPPNTAPNPSPVLVEVDTNAKLEADPGAGVGVFAEYAAGGKWHVFWACDTSQTGRDCDYQVKIRPTQGKLSNVVDDGGKPIATTGGEISIRRTIGLKNDGVRFDGDAGGIVTLEVSLDGKPDNVLFFFVQNGKLNGGYEGTLTNPIKLQGKTP